jgi:hypothetical protein
MKSELIQLSYEIELQPGDKLTLPLSLMERAVALTNSSTYRGV